MVTKLCDSEFFRKAKAADVFAKVYNLFINAGVGRGGRGSACRRVAAPAVRSGEADQTGLISAG